MPQAMLQNGVSVGVEFEVEDFLVNNLPREFRNIWNPTHDASCEKDVHLLGNGLIFNKCPQIFPYRNIVLGGEMVSGILDTSDESFIIPIRDLTNFLLSQGESLQSFRAGIHVHVCYSNANLQMLKGTIKLWKYLEDLFFHVGGMGYTFRGTKNDAIYCRPLTKNGPIVVQSKGNNVKSVDLEDLLSATTISSFWERWGDLLNQGRERYFPVRYHAFNLSPALTRGSIEFRVFNKCLNPLFIVACINLCKKFAEFAMMTRPDEFSSLGFLEENSIYLRRDKNSILETFLKFAQITSMDEFTVREIITIIELTPQIILSDDVVFSHLRNAREHWENSDYEPVKILSSSVRRPNFVDLHVLRGER